MNQVLVIGGTGGLGAAVVAQLARGGRDVVVAGQHRSSHARVRRSYVLDAMTADWAAVYAQIEEETRVPLDAIVFVSGCAVFGRTPLIPVERARRTFELNFWGCAGAATAAARHWSERRTPGTFAAVLSIVARRAVPFEAYYAASKAAAARFLESLELEYEPHGMRFVSAFPGMLDTGFRRTAEWFGLEPPGTEAGSDVTETARAVVDLLAGRRKSRVIGWRERTIDLADRLAPGLYDRAVLSRRVKRRLG